MVKKNFSTKISKLIFFGVIFTLFIFLIGISDSQAAVSGTSTALTSSFPNNKVIENYILPTLKIELSRTATETINTISVTLATTTAATPIALATSSFNWLGVTKDDGNGLSDSGDTFLATTTTNIGATTSVNIASATTTPAQGIFFVVLKTAGTSTFTDNGFPDTGGISQKFTLSIASNGVVTSTSSPAINATTTQEFVADTHSQTPSVSILQSFYQGGIYYIQEQSSQTLGEQGTTTVYNSSTSTTAIATAILNSNGNLAGPISLGSQYLSSVWLELRDVLSHSTSTRAQFNLPALPTFTTIRAFTDRIILEANKNLRGDQAGNCSNYQINGVSPTCGGLGQPFIEFSGNRLTIKDFTSTLGSTINFNVTGLIQDTNFEQFPLTFSTSTTVQQASLPTISSISPNSTSTGKAVIISGSNFGTATGTVLFSGGFNPSTGPLPPISASTTVWSNTSITATVPVSARSGPVQIITSDGMNSDISDASFFDVLVNVYFKLVNTTTTSPITTSTNMRIFVGSLSGENVYYVGDSQGTTFNGSTYVYTVTNISSMGFAWAFDASGTYLPSRGSELSTNNSSTEPLILILPGTTTRKVSGIVTLGGSCSSEGQNKLVAVFAMPEGVETQMGPGGPQPSFFKTGSNCTTSYAVALPGNGLYRVEAHLPPQTTASLLLDPSGQTITISDANPTETVNFTFTSADRKIYGRIVGGDGNPLSAQKYQELWIFAFQPKTDGKSSVTKANSSGYFSLYVTQGAYKIGIGGPMMPFPVEKDIIVDNSATFNLDSTTLAITIKLEPPTTYISGYVKDGAGNSISNVDIYSWCDGGPGGGHAFTDSQGFYKMYVSPCSNYHVSGFGKNYGQLTEQTGIAVTPSSNPTVNFTLSSSDFINVYGQVTKNSSALSNVDVWITQSSFGQGLGWARSDSSGNYNIALKKGYSNLYLQAAIPGKGEIYNQLLSSGALNSSTTQNITVNTAIIEIRLAPGNTFENVFLGARSSIGHGFTDKRISTSTSYDVYKIEVPYSGATQYTIDGGIPGFGPIPATTTSISASTTININLGSISFYTVSGSVSADTGTSSDAFVWAGGSQGGGGTKVASDGTFSMKLREGTYDIGVGKTGYTGSVTTSVNVNTNITNLNLTLTKNTATISGFARVGSTAIANAWVWADDGAGGWAGAVSEADGSFSLNVSVGEWKLNAIADGYQASSPTRITAPASGVIISLSSVTFDPKRREQSVKPTEGGVIQTDDSKVEIPSGALGTGSTDTSIKVQNTMKVPEAKGVKIISAKAREITASYSSGSNEGQSISVLDKSINIEIVVTKAELTAIGISNLTDAKKIKLGYYDSTASNWVELSTVVTLNPSSASTFNDLTSITLKATTQHLSTFAPEYPSEGAPPAPTDLTATAGNGRVNLSWSTSSGATKYNIYRRNDSQYPYLAQTANIPYTDTALTNGTTYYYKVSALNDADQESAATGSVSATPEAGGGGGGGGAVGPIAQQDTTAPSISNIKVVAADTQATITWQTSESSISWIIYGLNTNYGKEVKTTSYTTSHSVTLTSLTPSTTYHYQVKSKDSSGNIASFTDKTFTTLAAGEKIAAPEEKITIPTLEKPISEMTIAELQVKITEILAVINKLQAQLAQLKGEAPACAITSFERNLKQGNTGEDVKCLQIILNSDSDTRLAESGVGSPGSETAYFGALTKAAIIKFQEKYASEILAPWELTKGTGIVGKATREKLNQFIGQ